MAQNAAASLHPLAGVTSKLDQIAPRFEIDSSAITILDSPSAFYETLKEKIRGARRRIYLSTLYIGKSELELIDVLDEALRQNAKLQVSILTDALRGTREAPEPSCASLLAKLVSKHGDRVQISMFHTPNLRGLKKKYIPRRINEGWGLQHMKLYGFDDEIMLSGANLSNDYFTNRLDRYHLFSSTELAEYYHRIHDAVSTISFRVLPSEDPQGFTLESPLHRALPDPVWHPSRFRAYAKFLLEPLLQPTPRQTMFPTPFTSEKTFIYPIAQFDILLGEPKNSVWEDYEFARYTSTEKPVLSTVLAALAEEKALKGSAWMFTAGYFNIDPDISELLLAAAPTSIKDKDKPDEATPPSPAPCTVITASPQANGFYNSPGISGMLPAAYTLLSRRFLRAVAKAGRAESVQLKEWRRGTVGEEGAWTYHAKGLWLTLPSAPQEDASPGRQVEEEGKESLKQHEPSEFPQTETAVDAGPSLAVIGSSNYTKRSYSLDLEVGAVVVTGNADLQRRLREETEWLQRDAKVVDLQDLKSEERRVGWKVRAAMWIVEKVGGAL